MTLKDTELKLLHTVNDGNKNGGMFYSTDKAMAPLAKLGLVETNPNMKNEKGETPFRLTDAGKKELPTVTEPTTATAAATGTPGASPAVSFKIMAMPLPVSKRAAAATGREPKYPLATIPVGQAIFIPAEKDADPKAASKAFGSMVSSFNKNNPDKYITARGLENGNKVVQQEDGTWLGFGEEYEGVPGTALYSLDPKDKPARQPRKAKDAAPAGVPAEGTEGAGQPSA
jgi:hypothetical protein